MVKQIKDLKVGDSIYHFNNHTYLVFKNELDFDIEVDGSGECDIVIGEMYDDCVVEEGMAKYYDHEDGAESNGTIVYFYADEDTAIKKANDMAYEVIYDMMQAIDTNNKMY